MGSSRARPAALLAAAAGALVLAGAAPSPPQQPFKFSHKVHAGDNHIGCTSCHVYADRGPVAGVPSMLRCQGCHKFVKEDKENAQLDEELKALRKVLEDGKPVEWARVHRVPDHVRFVHQRHVLSGVACRDCHGAVEEMQVVHQVAPLSMGWCLECHRRKQAERPVERARLTDCWTCHK